MRSRGRCSGSGRRAGLRRSNAGTVIFSAAPRRRHPRRRLGLRGVLFQVGELKLELLEQRAALRGLAEPLVPQLGDRELELLDQQRAVCASLSAAVALACAALSACRWAMISACAAREVVGKRIIGAHRQQWNHNTRLCVRAGESHLDSQCRDQPAACGRQVCCGIRQSMPSSK